MTRINTIPPQQLHSKHLLAEYRELPRVFKQALKHSHSPQPSPIPDTYRMGAGHVTFFFNKLRYLQQRHKALIDEMHNRGYQTNITNVGDDLQPLIPARYWQDWQPTETDHNVNRARINERLKEMEEK